MNKKSKFYVYLFLLIILISCEDYLAQNPDNRLELDSLDKLAKTLVNAYPRYSYSFTDYMSDNADYCPLAINLDVARRIYEWRECLESGQDTPKGYWTVSYYSIVQANLALDKINSIKEDDKAYKNAIIGEALLCRAYAHFMLVNLFAKPYNKDTASSDLGVPYVTKVEKQLIVPYQRNTVQEVYDLVEKDLLEGLKLVSSQYYRHSGKFHFTKESALAFASRFYLWKGAYKKAEEYAAQLLSQGEEQFVRDYKNDVLKIRNFKGIEQGYSEVSLPANLLLVTSPIYGFPNHYAYGYGITLGVIKQVFKGYTRDYRTTQVVMQRTGAYYIPRIRTFYNDALGYRVSTQVLFTGEEVVLNRAEARLMQGNITGAEHDLILIFDKRYHYPFDSKALLEYMKDNLKKDLSEKDKVLSIILQQRRIEFITQGLRWFDIRRFHLTISHKLEDGTEDTLTQDDPRKVLQIPDNAIQFGLKPNPRKEKDISSKIIKDNIALKNTKNEIL